MVVKIAVITTSVGSNKPVAPIIQKNNIDYHAFLSEDLFQSNIEGWNKHKCSDFTIYKDFKDRRNAKVCKILPFCFLPQYDYFVYIDSGHVLIKDPEEIIQNYLKDTDIAVFKHPERNCVYKEGEEIKKIEYDLKELVDQQLNFYKEVNYPEGNGLYELPARIQRNTKDMQTMSLTWWELICKFSSRDQLSFPYACYKHNIKPSILPGKSNSYRGNDMMMQVITPFHRRNP
jgi:hypothetical protein